MRAVKIVAGCLGGLALLLVAAAAFFLASFDADKWKGELTRLVEKNMHRSLKIEGDLSVSLLPVPAVRLGKATLSELRSEQVFARIDGAGVALQLMPLFAGQVVVNNVDIDGLKVRLVRFSDGHLNIDDLLPKDANEPPARFDIAGARLANAELTWHDEQAGTELTLSALNLATGRLANAASDRFELSATMAADKPRLAATLQVSGEYRYDLAHGVFGAARLDARLAGDVAALHGLDMTLAATSVRFAAKARAAGVEQLVLRAKGKEAGEAFEATLEVPKFAWAAGKASGSAASAALRQAGGQHSIEVKVGISDIEGSGRVLKAGKLAIDLDLRRSETTVKGSLAAALSADLESQTIEVPAFSGELVLAHPQLPMRRVALPLAGGLRADIDGQTADLHADARLDESRIAARLHVARFSPLTLGFDLDIDQLNVDKYLLPKTAAAGARTPGEPLDFAALKGLNASGVVGIGQLQASNVKAGKVRLEIKAGNDRPSR